MIYQCISCFQVVQAEAGDEVGACAERNVIPRKSFSLVLTNRDGYYVLMKCPVHKVELVCYCPACRGSITTARKAAAAQANGKLGGRPKGSKNKPKPVRRKRG